MIFIRPKILRDAAQSAFETDLKYNYMIEQERQSNQMGRHDAVPLLPGETHGALPPLPPGGSAPVPHGPGTPPTSQGLPANPAPAPAAPVVAPGTPAPDAPAASPAGQPPPKQ
jgi:hypothetical protein